MKIRITSAGTATNLPPEFELEWPFETAPQVGMSVRFTDPNGNERRGTVDVVEYDVTLKAVRVNVAVRA